jgi:hypothetical protein
MDGARGRIVEQCVDVQSVVNVSFDQSDQVGNRAGVDPAMPCTFLRVNDLVPDENSETFPTMA